MLLALRVVLLAVDATALAVLFFLEAALLLCSDVAVGAGARFGTRVARLSGFELRRLARGEAARAYALLNARLLVGVALHVGLHALRRSGARVAGLRVVFLAVDVAAHFVLFARKARLLGGTQFAVAHGA